MTPERLGDKHVCAWCESPALRKSGRQMLCVKHIRFQHMRVSAQRYGKAVPSYEELEILLCAGGLVCGDCQCQMNWLQKEGVRTTVTLQHYRSGIFGLVCHSCNSRHRDLPGDLYREIPDGYKWCSGCEQVLTVDCFWKCKNRPPLNLTTYCKTCSDLRNREWISRNRESFKTKRREQCRKRSRRLAEPH